VSHQDEWTTFNDLSGHFSSIPAREWLGFAERDEFFLAGYNDAIPYGELVSIREGIVEREFLDVGDNPQLSVNCGNLASERAAPIASWVDVASIVDDDDLGFNETGALWLLS
jgi:hypothetical protein